MKIAIIDTMGLSYDGYTLKTRGLGGSESAVILMADELYKLGFEVTVFNNCQSGEDCSPGMYSGVEYIDNSQAKEHNEIYDVVVVSRTVIPFIADSHPFVKFATKRMLWLHDTFIQGDHLMEQLVVDGTIDHVLTLSDWHTSYILNANHKGPRRNYEVLKKSIFQTRNGAVKYSNDVRIADKDPNLFVYNSSATKGMIPLVHKIWPEIKKQIPEARLLIIGGYYEFPTGPDAQEQTVRELMNATDNAQSGIEFTGIISQQKVSEILAKANMMLYPCAFPETFGISSLESLLYNTPIVTTRFGALEETAVDMACYKINYAIEPNSLFPDIDHDEQVAKFVEQVMTAYHTPYLHQQKQNYCSVVHDIATWDTVALQWKQFIYDIMGEFLSRSEYRTVSKINDKVARVFGRCNTMPAYTKYHSYVSEKPLLVISPFYNAADFIQKNILSVAQQNYESYQHVLIDDNSTDEGWIIAKDTIAALPKEIQNKFILIKNNKRQGAVYNQLITVNHMVSSGRTTEDTLVMLLDGDDWLVNNNTLFHYYNDLCDQGYEYTYGSMFSLADQIPLIAQEYPDEVKQNKTYRAHLFNWKIPYTHLRTCIAKYFQTLDHVKFMTESGEYMQAGADNPLFYELIEQVSSDKIYCNKEIVCIYNDINPINDYKINGQEQNKNAMTSYHPTTKKKTILIAIPTNRYIEPETMKSIYDLEIPDGYSTDFQFFHGYQIDQIRNLIAKWALDYDYLLSVDSDIVLPKDCLTKMISADKDIISGLYIQRIPNTHTLEIYKRTQTGGSINIHLDELPKDTQFEIVGCGMGCCLIKSKVFQLIKYPHYLYKSALTSENTISEDIYFCEKALEQGFKIWADSSIRCDHIGSTMYRVNDR